MKPATKISLWKFGGLTPLRLTKRVWKNIGDDEVSVRSTSLAYYFVLAVFPGMLFVLSIIGLLAPAGSPFHEALFSNLARVLPGSAADLIRKTLQEVSVASGTGKALFGILGALWSASSGISAVMQSLDVAYKVKEDRPMWKQRAIAVGLTLALAILVLTALALTLFGGKAAEFIGAHLGKGIVVIWDVVQWPLVLAVMFVAFAITYYFAPNLKEPEWHWITPGSAAGLVLWLIISLGFKLYLNFFNSYSKTYGSLGAVIILLLWLYITGFSIMIGGELNSEIGRAGDAQQRYEDRQSQIVKELKAA